MRRIIFGAIWLTGFLAVLLAWAMMWSRAQGEGPRRMIGTRYTGYSCQLVLVTPDAQDYRPSTPHMPECGVTIIGWSADQEWLYYQFIAEYEDTGAIYGVERIDRNFDQREVVVDRLTNGNLWFSSNRQFLLYENRESKHVYRLSVANNGLTDLSVSFRESHFIGFSPHGEWLILQTLDDNYRWEWYQSTVDGMSPLLTDLASISGKSVILWSDIPEWLVLYETFERDGNSEAMRLYKMRPDGSDFTLLLSSEKNVQFSHWVHHSGIIGLQAGDTFYAMWVDTGEILWKIAGVDRVYIKNEWDSPKDLEKDWVYFMMADGRLARCRFDGTELTFFDPHGLPVWRIWDWTPDGKWVWFETAASNPDLVDIMRVQASTGKVELMVDETYFGQFFGWSPDGKWAYYGDEYGRLKRVRIDGKGKPQVVNDDANIVPLTWTPPYQSEWQPTHTLAIGIGLMSFSTLTPIVLWRRRQKPRTT